MAVAIAGVSISDSPTVDELHWLWLMHKVGNEILALANKCGSCTAGIFLDNFFFY